MSDGDQETPAASEESSSTESAGDAAKPSSTASAAPAKPTAAARSATPAARKDPPRPPVVTRAQWIFLLVVAVVTAGVDLWSKSWAMSRLSIPSPRSVPLCTPRGSLPYEYQRVPTRAVPVVRNSLEFRYAENCGGAWGFLHGTRESLRRPFFVTVALAAVAFILHLYRQLERDQKLMRWALPLVLGGAIGNLVDRVRLGFVVDFIDFRARWVGGINRLFNPNADDHWPTFNVADIAISVGIGLMILEWILGARSARKPNKSTAPST